MKNGHLIEEARIASKKYRTREKLAIKCGVSRNTIYRIERDENMVPTIATLHMVCKVLGLDIRKLLD